MKIPTMRAHWLMLVTLVTLGLSACSGESTGPKTQARVASVTISMPRTSFRVGESVQAGALPLDSVGGALTGRSVTWASETPEIVSVSNGGLVTGLNPGVATISATVEEKRTTVNVQVSLIPVSTITVSPTAQTVSAGGAITLNAVLKDSADRVLTGRGISWRSANPSTASVTGNGVVTGILVGTTDVFASAEGKEAKATITVNTVNTPVATVTITGANNLMSGGARKMLSATLKDANGNVLGGRAITWSTSDASRATVANGEVTAAPVDAPVVITATSEGKSSTFSINIITFTRLTSGNGFACGLTGDGTAYCWGIIGGTLPTAVATEVKFAAISAGNAHVCALGITGGTYCWGSNSSGQLGTGNTTSLTTPSQVTGGQQFISVAAGPASTCATTASLEVYCWGLLIRPRNMSTYYDEGARSNVTTPVKVGTGIVAVVGGGVGPAYEYGNPDRYCGLDNAGTAFCWYRLMSNQINADGPSIPLSPLHFSTLRMGAKHICGVELSKLTFCVGENNQGQLGDGTTTNRSTMTQISGGFEFQAIATGTNHTCGMTPLGTTYCWGSNSDGQLGIGANGGSRLTPAKIDGIAFTGIRGGNLFTCGLAVGGAAYCWGNDQNRQLGDGTTASSNLPRQVFGN